MKFQLVFARQTVGTDGQGVACHIDVGHVFVVLTKMDIIVGALHCLVVLLADQPRGVVALKLHDNLDRIAQIVGRKRLSQRLLSLYVAAHHTASQHDGGGVPDISAGHIFGEHVTCLIGRILIVDEETIVGEIVSSLHGLHAVYTLGYAQLESSLRVGLNGLVVGIVDGVAIQEEGYSRDRNAGVAVVDIA